MQERLWVPLHTQHLYDFYRAHVSDKGIPSSGWLGKQAPSHYVHGILMLFTVSSVARNAAVQYPASACS